MKIEDETNIIPTNKLNIIKRVGSDKTGYYLTNIQSNVPVNVPVNDRQKKIILLIKDNKNITTDLLADECQVNVKTIKRDEFSLKSQGLNIFTNPNNV